MDITRWVHEDTGLCIMCIETTRVSYYLHHVQSTLCELHAFACMTNFQTMHMDAR
jgi:hypothetical protein